MEELSASDPTSLGPYRLLGRLGSGGMGRVFLGQSPGGRLVAVKVIRDDLASMRDFRVRFASEVAAARAVSGVLTAPVIDADVEGAMPWLATAYVAGPSLANAVAVNGPLPAASVLALAAGLAEGLSAIHSAGLVHRDLKPSNVLLADDGPRVIDFGISRAADASVMTSTGLVVGTAGFMSPEQATGLEVGPASDIFSLGAVLAFAATGEGPFGSGSVPALVYRVVHELPGTAGLPTVIRLLAERCLAKEPDQRPTAAQLLAQLAFSPAQPGWLPPSVVRSFAGRESALGQQPCLAGSRAAHANPPWARTPTETADAPRYPPSDADYRKSATVTAPPVAPVACAPPLRIRSAAHSQVPGTGTNRRTMSSLIAGIATIAVLGSLHMSWLSSWLEAWISRLSQAKAIHVLSLHGDTAQQGTTSGQCTS
jgi:eukaryotic-like serine/threonine-protein kinase